MSSSAAHADAFYDEVLEHEVVWAVRDGDGFPVPETPGGRAMPFWSLRTRAERVVGAVAAYAGFEVVPVPLEEWRARWLPGLARDGLLVGLNWSGAGATGFDVAPADVERNLAARDST